MEPRDTDEGGEAPCYAHLLDDPHGDVTPRKRVKIEIVPYDPEWPRRFERIAAEVRDTLGPVARDVVHVGSTSVPGLAAKPIIDVVVLVDDSTDEDAYVPALAARGYEVRVREPDWFEHRMLKRFDPTVNLHVFSVGCDEVADLVRFRDWLRTHDDDRRRYEETKRALAMQEWDSGQHYADAKTDVVREILERAR
jgi:GrpB-like predicted nucleotidyltransferase (UPF0157 family)